LGRLLPANSNVITRLVSVRFGAVHLNFLTLICIWKNGRVVATFRQPFDMLAETITETKTRPDPVPGAAF
jgi:hypothetical protein